MLKYVDNTKLNKITPIPRKGFLQVIKHWYLSRVSKSLRKNKVFPDIR